MSPCEIACINVSEHAKNPQRWQPYHCLDISKILDTLTGIGSAALAAAVPTRVW